MYIERMQEEALELERVKRAHAQKMMQQQQQQQQQSQQQRGPRPDKTMTFKPSQVMGTDEGHLETKGQSRIIRIKQLDDASIAFRAAERTLAARGLPAPAGLALPRLAPEPFEPLSSFLEVAHQGGGAPAFENSAIYEEYEDEGCEVNGEKQMAGIYLKSRSMQEENKDDTDSQVSPDVEIYASEDATVKLNSASVSLNPSEFRNQSNDGTASELTN